MLQNTKLKDMVIFGNLYNKDENYHQIAVKRINDAIINKSSEIKFE